MNKWNIYEALKKDKELDTAELILMSAEEIKEGLIEFSLFKKHGEIGGEKHGK